ncbi:hypothetical protein [Frigidibacter mobilis]|uniref:hypothetical protein n=1 Tax=Frigidibacter mobilis TaxID=1335048 RepID=UPI0009FD37DF|nr:hypothetical protein [Frigidibacter mobilis]
MGKAFIFNEHLDRTDRDAIEAAVRAAGYEPIYGVPADISTVDAITDIGVVGLPVAPEDEAVVNSGTRLFGGAGIRVVGIWLHEDGVDGVGLPEELEKYGSTAVRIGSPDLPEALAGERDVWEEPSGATRAAPTTKRNKC